jgi:glycerol kinase
MMTAPTYVMALDLGTTGNRAILFDRHGTIAAQAYKELTQYYPHPGWVEHDPREIWDDTCWAMQAAIKKAGIQPQQIASIGLTVQRETCLLWNKTTGRPLHNAIVWQDRRTAAICRQLAEQGHVDEIYDRTGLVLDAYFSASKLHWLLKHLEKDDPPMEPDNILAGTIDSWVLWNLTGGQVHATDDSSASRTMLLNLVDRQWDDKMLSLFGIPREILPSIQPSIGHFGKLAPDILGAEIPITAIFGDQQAALYAHGCDRPGLLKCTYGTGCFLVSHTGNAIARSKNHLLSTIAWTQSHGDQTEVGYALEGSMFTAGACIQWLRDGLKLITAASDTGPMAEQVSDNAGAYFVPALSGLGAPHWDMTARGAFLGLTAAVQREHMVRAVLEAIAYQACEVVTAIDQDGGTKTRLLKVDGGACQNDFLMQFQADVLGIPVERPAILDATAQGAAFAAGLAVGFWDDYRTLVDQRKIDRVFEPSANRDRTRAQFSRWQQAVERSKHWVEE